MIRLGDQLPFNAQSGQIIPVGTHMKHAFGTENPYDLKEWTHPNGTKYIYDENKRSFVVKEDEHVPSYMNRSSLEAIKANVEYLLSIISDKTKVDNWAEDHIATAAHDLSQVADYMRGRNGANTDSTTEAFTSKAQQGYFYAKANDKDASAAERAKWKKMADEFSKETDFKSLPDKKESVDSKNYALPIVRKSLGENKLAQLAARKIGVDFNKVDKDQFMRGFEVEREHDDVTGGDPEKVAKIVMAHLKEVPDYYTKLAKYVEG